MSDAPSYTRTVLQGRDHEALEILIALHAVRTGKRLAILDATCNQGTMWRDCTYAPTVRMDIDPLHALDVVGDFTAMPFEAGSFDVVVFDPPHLPTHAASKNSSKIWKRRYGITEEGAGREEDNVSGMFMPFLVEAERVLRPGGIVLAKIADLVHNHRYQWQQVAFVLAVEQVPGLSPCDMLIKADPNAGSLMSSKWQNPKHLRKAHCYWIVVRKGRCERPGNAEVEEVEPLGVPRVSLPDYRVCWQYVCRYVTNFDFVLLPGPLWKAVLDVVTNCPVCGVIVHPFQPVQGQSHFTIKPACPSCAETEVAKVHAVWLQGQLVGQS